MNVLVIFRGLSATGLITGIPNVQAGDNITNVLDITNVGEEAAFFDPKAPANGQIVQSNNIDLSARTFVALISR